MNMTEPDTLNKNPSIATSNFRRSRPFLFTDFDEDVEDPLDAEEIFNMIRDLNDPEHPLTLEQLSVVSPDHISVAKEPLPIVHVEFTPTIPHCSMATLIGLTIRVKLSRSLPFWYKIDVIIHPGTHVSEAAINKQLNDKERVAAAMENEHLRSMVNKCIGTKL